MLLLETCARMLLLLLDDTAQMLLLETCTRMLLLLDDRCSNAAAGDLYSNAAAA